ncbi:hypothetical protein [Armatimonas rosea]|uniref:Uncharacterized protein n=1 Tax=Armatimonas rosea TaxID=685828 RepID=A0A7W9SQ86_ARMRO|nr:hypothetical protein [Armatimonas rosea]MBB6050831.1 hypothetical protein [Armatimonas rosea]
MPETTESTPSALATTPKPRKLTPRTIASKLRRAELLLDGTESHPEIITLVEPFGYTATKRAEGRALLQAAQTQLGLSQLSRAVQKQKTEVLVETEKVARRAYADLAAAGRALFPAGSHGRTALGLSGNTPQGLTAFLRAADALFDGATNGPADVKAALAAHGYTEAKLTTEHAKITALKAADSAQEGAKGGAQELTPQQNDALAALDKWAATYLKFARIALRDRPQLLEKLDVKA